jgi:hypothetical protein
MPALEPVTVQRRASATGTIMIAGQVIHIGRPHAGRVTSSAKIRCGPRVACRRRPWPLASSVRR